MHATLVDVDLDKALDLTCRSEQSKDHTRRLVGSLKKSNAGDAYRLVYTWDTLTEKHGDDDRTTGALTVRARALTNGTVVGGAPKTWRFVLRKEGSWKVCDVDTGE